MASQPAIAFIRKAVISEGNTLWNLHGDWALPRSRWQVSVGGRPATRSLAKA
jgi:hypothetical protein